VQTQNHSAGACFKVAGGGNVNRGGQLHSTDRSRIGVEGEKSFKVGAHSFGVRWQTSDTSSSGCILNHSTDVCRPQRKYKRRRPHTDHSTGACFGTVAGGSANRGGWLQRTGRSPVGVDRG
jgi:hypothetical protein